MMRLASKTSSQPTPVPTPVPLVIPKQLTQIPPKPEERLRMIQEILTKRSDSDLTAALKPFFHFYDDNGDGRVSFKEFKVILDELGIETPRGMLERMWSNADADKSGGIDEEEIEKMMA